MAENYEIVIPQKRWKKMFEKVTGFFDVDALIQFGNSQYGETLFSENGKLVFTVRYISDCFFRNEATGSTTPWTFYVIKFYEHGNFIEKWSIEFKSWNDPETGEQCVGCFLNYGYEFDDEDLLEMYNMLGTFFPLYPEWDMKEPDN